MKNENEQPTFWKDKLAEIRRQRFPSLKDKMITGFEKIVNLKNKKYEQLHEQKQR